MTATKIINVVKDDSFDEIFDLFKSAAAEEVIFILPKKNRVLANESQFQKIHAEAKELGKRVAVLSSNPDVVALAKQYQFEILQDKSSSPKKAKAKKAEVEPVPVLASATDPSDNDPIPDDSDAFDPTAPSDETMGVIDDSEEESGRDVDTEEVLDDDAADQPAEDDVVENETEAPEMEVAPEENVEPEDEIDESAYQDFGSEDMDDPELSRAPLRKPIARAATAHHAKRLAPTSAGLKKGKLGTRNLDELEEVWQHESFAPGASVWTDQPPRQKPGLLGRMFSKKEQTPQVRPTVRQTSFAPPRKSRRALTASLMVLVLAGGGVVYTQTGKAQIVITPFSKKLDFDLGVNVSDQFSQIDSTFNKLPGQLFTVSKSVTQEFQSSGQREVAQKARGKLTVYNTLNTTAQTLIATTRFESANGMIFRTLRTVTVPGMSGTTPGTVEVEIIADKAGEAYNVPAGKFTIPAFKEKNDAERFAKFYGQSTEPMKEGKSGMARVVTEQDFARSKEAVQNKLRDEILEALRDEASGLKIADTASISLTKTESSTAVDQAADTFMVTMEGQVKTMGFREDDLMKLVRAHVEKNYGLTLVPDKVELSYKSAIYRESRGILELNLHLTGNGYGQINTGQITTDLLGKGEGDIVGYLKSADGVAEAKVLLSPFWVKKVPKKAEKVNIQLDYQ